MASSGSSVLGSSRVNSQNFQRAFLRHEKELSSKGIRRGRLDIIAEILFFCGQPKTKTGIMYNANLNYSQLKMHMDSLTDQGLLVKDINKFCTTEKGREFLHLFVRLNGLVEDFNPQS